MLEDLSDEQIKQLVADHWREIVGLSKELQRRRNKQIVLDTNNEPLGP
jgi:hypothetical protein